MGNSSLQSIAWTGSGPRETALSILEARFQGGGRDRLAGRHAESASTFESGTTQFVFPLTHFQLDAVRRANRILDRWGGVLIADSVGLGKTYIGLALAQQALHDGGRVAVITPAALRPTWVPLLRRLARELDQIPTHGFGRRSRLDTRGSGPELSSAEPPPGGQAEDTGADRLTGPALIWTSHTRLARGTAPDALYQGVDLVIVDEAHAFRNPRTRRYQALAQLTLNAHVVLITATPINNSVMDLLAILRLFAGPGDFIDLGISDLDQSFRAADSGDQESSANGSEIQRVVRTIMIRRTRDLIEFSPPDSPAVANRLAAPRFPVRRPSIPVRYSLQSIYPDLLPNLAETLAALSFAPFRLGEYGLDSAASNAPAELIRLGLLKRLESSIHAFWASAERQLHFIEAFLHSLKEGLLRLPSIHRALYEEGDRQGAQLTLESLILMPIPPTLDLERLQRDLASDRDMLLGVLDRLSLHHTRPDPKLEQLAQLIETEIGHEKVIIFSEFRETARYLWRALRGRAGTALIDGGGAFVGITPAHRDQVIRWFAPRANNAPDPPPEIDLQILIATDILAEGLNLQDAGHLINYDLHWNPVRLMQRIGRIDRIGSPHPAISTYHFLPDHELDQLIRLSRRLHHKLDTIQKTMGTGDAFVLGSGAEYRSHELGAAHDEIMRAAYYRTLHDQPPPRPAPLPAATLIYRPHGTRHTTLIACASNDQVHLIVQYHDRGADEHPQEDDAVAAEILLSALELPDNADKHPHLRPDHGSERSPAGSPGKSCQSPNQEILDHAWNSARQFIEERQMAMSKPAPLPPHSPGAEATRRIMRLLTDTPGHPDPELCKRIDLLLPRLARQQSAGTDLLLRRALRETDLTLDSLLDHLESALGPGQRKTTTTPTETMIQPIAVIEVRPEERDALSRMGPGFDYPCQNS